MSAQVLRSDRRTLSASYLLVIITNAARQCLALASRSSLLRKSVRSSASSRSRSICGTSFTNAGLRVTESITAHKSRPGNFSIVYRIVDLNLRNRMSASSRRGLLHSQERTFIGGVAASVSCQNQAHAPGRMLRGGGGQSARRQWSACRRSRGSPRSDNTCVSARYACRGCARKRASNGGQHRGQTETAASS